MESCASTSWSVCRLESSGLKIQVIRNRTNIKDTQEVSYSCEILMWRYSFRGIRG